ncbi:MAG: lycopene cyclase domain-containing protein, partial [Cyclobacteriaceae bacterium]
MQWLYFILMGGSLIFPLAWSFEKRVSYHKNWKSLFPAIFLTALFFLFWDEVFTQRGVWGFNDSYISGIKFGSLPLEEILFFIVVPFSCVFIYECVGYFLPGNKAFRKVRALTYALGVFLLIVALFNY